MSLYTCWRPAGHLWTLTPHGALSHLYAQEQDMLESATTNRTVGAWATPETRGEGLGLEWQQPPVASISSPERASPMEILYQMSKSNCVQQSNSLALTQCPFRGAESKDTVPVKKTLEGKSRVRSSGRFWECAPACYCKSGIVASIWLESRCPRRPTLHRDLRPALPGERSGSPPLGRLPRALQGCSCEACDLKRSARLTVPTLMSNGRKTSEILPKAS